MSKVKLPDIVGIAGTNGAGKDSTAAYLASQGGYQSFSISDELRSLLDEKGQPHTRQNLSQLSQSIRQREGGGALVDRLLQRHSGQRICLISLRTPEEVMAIKSQGGAVLWVDADSAVRYQRVSGGARGRVTDAVSYEEFLRQEAVEMSPTEAGGGLNMSAVRELADYVVDNDFKKADELHEELRQRFKI